MKCREHDYEVEKYLIATHYDWEIVFGKFDSYLLSKAVAEDIRYFYWIISASFPIRVIDIICEMLDREEAKPGQNLGFC